MRLIIVVVAFLWWWHTAPPVGVQNQGWIMLLWAMLASWAAFLDMAHLVAAINQGYATQTHFMAF